jgi:hypothetical protein
MRVFILLFLFNLCFNLTAQDEVEIFKKNGGIVKFVSASFYVDRLRFKPPLLIVESEKGKEELDPFTVSMIVKNRKDTMLLFKGKLLVTKINGTMDCFAIYERMNEVFIPYTGLFRWVNSYVSFKNDSLIKLNRKSLKVINNLIPDIQIKKVKNSKNVLSTYNCR